MAPQCWHSHSCCCSEPCQSCGAPPSCRAFATTHPQTHSSHPKAPSHHNLPGSCSAHTLRRRRRRRRLRLQWSRLPAAASRRRPARLRPGRPPSSLPRLRRRPLCYFTAACRHGARQAHGTRQEAWGSFPASPPRRQLNARCKRRKWMAQTAPPAKAKHSRNRKTSSKKMKRCVENSKAKTTKADRQQGKHTPGAHRPGRSSRPPARHLAAQLPPPPP